MKAHGIDVNDLCPKNDDGLYIWSEWFRQHVHFSGICKAELARRLGISKQAIETHAYKKPPFRHFIFLVVGLGEEDTSYEGLKELYSKIGD